MSEEYIKTGEIVEAGGAKFEVVKIADVDHTSFKLLPIGNQADLPETARPFAYALHNSKGPARIDRNKTTQEWWVLGKRHREDGPAIIYKKGNRTDEIYARNGKIEKILINGKPFNRSYEDYRLLGSFDTAGKSTSPENFPPIDIGLYNDPRIKDLEQYLAQEFPEVVQKYLNKKKQWKINQSGDWERLKEYIEKIIK